MEESVFNEIIESQLQLCREMLVVKGAEYATEKDRLHNFRVAAAIQGVGPAEALAGMMAKHTASIYDLICDDSPGSTLKVWEEKITAHINYLLLLKAIVLDAYLR